MDLQLKDKVIIVTGGAKGIGEGIVEVLAGEGAIPAIVGRNEEDNKAALKKIKGNGFQIAAELTAEGYRTRRRGAFHRLDPTFRIDLDPD